MPRSKPKKSAPRQPQFHTLRTPVLDDEIFAVATKMLGGANVRVVCADGMERLCVIRNKFRGRGKRGNHIGGGSLLLVGRRSWSGTREGKLPVCDLLCVYSAEEARTLQHRGLLPHSLLAGAVDCDPTTAADALDDGLEFANDAPLAELPDGFSDESDDADSAAAATALAPGDTVTSDDI
jgi:initiation factor 1A